MRKWCENGCPEHSLHTARRQTRMSARHQRNIFAAPIGTATPNAVYAQQGAKPACQQDISAKFSQLLLARLPRTTFTHSKPPNPNASNTSTQTFRSSFWHGYPERRLRPASCQTPHGRNTSRQNFRIFYCHGINTKVSQLLYNCGDKDLSHRHLLCKHQYNYGETDFSHRHLLCKRQYNYGDTDMSYRHLLCKHQYNCGGTDLSHRHLLNITAATQVCHTATSSANANITAATSRPAPSGDTARRNPF